MNVSDPHFSTVRRIATIATLSILTAVTAAAQAIPNMSQARRGPPQRNTVFQLSMQFTSGIGVNVSGESFGFNNFPPGIEAGPAVDRQYGNGFVGVDFEGNINDQTGSWGFAHPNQIDLENDHIVFSSFAYENLDPLEATEDTDGLAIDMSFNRTFLRPARNFWVGLTGGFQIGPIDADGGFTSEVGLIRLDDTYDLNGFIPPTVPFIAGPTEDANGNPFPAPKIGSIPLSRNISAISSTSTLESRYDISGGYYGFRLGAMVDYKLTEWFGVQLSAGASVILATAEFNYNELFRPPDGSDVIITPAFAKSDEYLSGYFAEASLQFWLNQRAGLFVNALMQETDAMEIATERQLATVDFSSTSSIGFGLFYTW